MSKQIKAFPQGNDKRNQRYPELEYGMDLRDYLAAHASEEDIRPYVNDLRNKKAESLRGTQFTGPIYPTPKMRHVAKYMYADAMMRVRNE